MKKLSFVCLFLALVCLSNFAYAEEARIGVDIEAQFAAMSIDELKAADESLERILNGKIIGSAQLQLSQSEAELALGMTHKLSVTCEGREITKKTIIEYKSSDTAVATVAKGTVTAKGGGSAVITVTATFEDGGVLSAQCTVTVYVPVKAVKISVNTKTSSVTMLVGHTMDVSAMTIVSPETATEKKVTYSVDDEEIAVIDEKGSLNAKKAGTVTVTATSAENTEKPKSASIKVFVQQPVESIAIAEAPFDVGKGNSHKLAYTVSPSDASNQKVVWSSADPKIAKVSAKGVVTGVGTGSTVITCAAGDGSEVFATAKVTVITAVKKVSLSSQSTSVTLGKAVALSATVTPSDATNSVLKWSSSDPSIASVDKNGNVTANDTGECTISAEATDGSGVNANTKIYVEPQLPIYVTSIHWQMTWGQKNGKMGVEAENLCTKRKIKSFDYTVKCYNYFNNTPAIEYLTYSGSTIKPGKTGKSKLSKYSVSGFTNAFKVEITPTEVYYTDGTSETIPEEYQYTSTFEM